MKILKLLEVYSRDTQRLKKYMNSDFADEVSDEDFNNVASRVVDVLSNKNQTQLFHFISAQDVNFDSSEYANVSDFIDAVEQGEYEFDKTNLGSEWWKKLPGEIQDAFYHEIMNDRGGVDDGHTKQQLSLSNHKLIPRNTWLVHFTNDSDEIAYNGFERGYPYIERLSLTTRQDDRGEEEGYNFAFFADSTDADFAASKGRYGSEAVLFLNSGVHTHHSGDREHQIIFWGPDVDKSLIVPLKEEGGDWQVLNHKTGDPVFSGDFKKVVQWVMLNFNQYKNVICPSAK